MSSERRAVIDVGTGSVKLLIADVTGSTVTPIQEESEQTRLGSGFYETHRLQPEAIQRTATAVGRFARSATASGVSWIRVIATSAARDALNQAELVAALRSASGLEPEVISGEQEADWVFAGVTSDMLISGRRLLIIDIGGGSTEFILGHRGTHSFRHSFQLGAMRLLAQGRLSDPPTGEEWRACQHWLQEFLAGKVKPLLDPALEAERPNSPLLVCTGGTGTIVAGMHNRSPTFDRDQIEATRLSREDVEAQRAVVWGKSLAERKRIVGLPPNRADVIVGGLAILAEVMAGFGYSEVRVSTRGLRFAALMDRSSSQVARV